MVRHAHARGKQSQSSIVLPLFIVLFVFSFAIMVYWYVSWRDLDARIHGSQKGPSDYDQPQKEGKEYKGYVYQLEEKHDRLAKAISERDKLEAAIGISNLAQMEDTLNETKKRLQSAYKRESDSDTFVVMIRRLQEEVNALRQQVKIAQDSRETAMKEAKRWEEASTASSRKFDEDTKKLRDNNAKAVQELNEAVTAKEAKIAELQQRIADLNLEHEKERDKTRAELTLASREVQRLNHALEEVQNRKVGGTDYNLDTDDVDAIVLSVERSGQACVVDIGRNQGAQVGMQFVVYDTAANGKRTEKATVELKKVDENSSLAGVSSLKDDLNPVLINDILLSPIYKRGEPSVFVFESNMDKAEKAVWAKKIEKFGNKVDEAVTSETSFVVIKDMPGNMAQEAGRWGVRVIGLNQLSKVLGER